MALPGRPRNHDPITHEIRHAIRCGDATNSKDLIERYGVEILDGEAATPLLFAVMHDQLEILNWLISKGANVNHPDRNGYCALHFAAQNRSVALASALLAAGATTELRDVYGNTPLWTAGFNARGDYGVFELLLRNGASLENTNNAGKSVRDLAMTLFAVDFKAMLKSLSL